MLEVSNADNVEIIQLNATGMRVIILFSLLFDKPRTLDEIMEEYTKHPLIKDIDSDDNPLTKAKYYFRIIFNMKKDD